MEDIQTMGIQPKKKVTIKHFTNVHCLRSILQNGLRFSDPATWEDKNDSALIELYERITAQKVYVLCFCNGTETLHHWSYYGQRNKTTKNEQDFYEEGVKCCIKFSPKTFPMLFPTDRRYELHPVKYRYISDLQEHKDSYNIEDLLLLKRKAYSVDKELRVIYKTSNTSSIANVDIIDFIELITLDGKLNKEEYKKLKASLIQEFPFLKGRIQQSSLYQSGNWVKAAQNIVNHSKQQ